MEATLLEVASLAMPGAALQAVVAVLSASSQHPATRVPCTPRLDLALLPGPCRW